MFIDDDDDGPSAFVVSTTASRDGSFRDAEVALGDLEEAPPLGTLSFFFGVEMSKD